MIVLRIPSDKIDEVFIKAGYKRHWNGTDYIKGLYNKKRWHAVPVKEGIVEIHLDRTNERTGNHFVSNWSAMNHYESNRLHGIINEIVKPNDQLPYIKKRGKTIEEFAPNLREIQRNHRQPVRVRWYMRFLNLFRQNQHEIQNR